MNWTENPLTQEEKSFLEGCGEENVFWSRSSFENCIEKLIRKDTSYEVANKLYSIRKKLGFELVPKFLPLHSTRDLDLYQPISLILGGKEYRAILWKKDKDSFSVMVFDNIPADIVPGSRLEFQVFREDDGKYKFYQLIDEVSEEAGHKILRLSHIEPLRRIDLRETPRWKASLPGKCHLKEDRVYEGRITDISTRGVRICIDEAIHLFPGASLTVEFSLGKHTLRIPSTVRNLYITEDKTCIGLQFEDISDSDEEMIRRWSYSLFK